MIYNLFITCNMLNSLHYYILQYIHGVLQGVCCFIWFLVLRHFLQYEACRNCRSLCTPKFNRLLVIGPVLNLVWYSVLKQEPGVCNYKTLREKGADSWLNLFDLDMHTFDIKPYAKALSIIFGWCVMYSPEASYSENCCLIVTRNTRHSI